MLYQPGNDITDPLSGIWMHDHSGDRITLRLPRPWEKVTVDEQSSEFPAVWSALANSFACTLTYDERASIAVEMLSSLRQMSNIVTTPSVKRSADSVRPGT